MCETGGVELGAHIPSLVDWLLCLYTGACTVRHWGIGCSACRVVLRPAEKCTLASPLGAGWRVLFRKNFMLLTPERKWKSLRVASSFISTLLSFPVVNQVRPANAFVSNLAQRRGLGITNRLSVSLGSCLLNWQVPHTPHQLKYAWPLFLGCLIVRWYKASLQKELLYS